MEITLNGKKKTLSQKVFLSEILQEMNLHPQSVVIERNGSIVGRSAYTGVSVEQGDTIEILQFVGGG